MFKGVQSLEQLKETQKAGEAAAADQAEKYARRFILSKEQQEPVAVSSP